MLRFALSGHSCDTDADRIYLNNEVELQVVE